MGDEAAKTPELPDGRFNSWCHRRVLSGSDKERMGRSLQRALSLGRTKLEQDMVFFHEFTGSSGVEFVLVSDVRLSEAVVLPHGVTIVPTFYRNLTGVKRNDPVCAATLRGC